MCIYDCENSILVPSIACKTFGAILLLSSSAWRTQGRGGRREGEELFARLSRNEFDQDGWRACIKLKISLMYLHIFVYIWEMYMGNTQGKCNIHILIRVWFLFLIKTWKFNGWGAPPAPPAYQLSILDSKV